MANRRQLDNERPDGRPIEGFVRIDPTDGGGGNNDDLDISKDFKTLTLLINSEEKNQKSSKYWHQIVRHGNFMIKVLGSK